MWQAIGAAAQICLLVLSFYLKRMSPRLLALKEEERSEEERQIFRAAVAARDVDLVSRLLDLRLRRLRKKNDLSDRPGKGDVS